MAKITLANILSGFSLTRINENFSKIQDALNNNVLFRDNPEGEDNTLKVDIDVNGHKLYNLAAPAGDSHAARLKDVKNAIAGLSGQTANLVAFSPTAHLTSNNVQGVVEEVDNKFLSLAANPAFFGAKLDGVTDDSAAVQAAVLSCAQKGGGTVRLPDVAPHKIKIGTSVIVPGYVTIDLNGYTVYGQAIGVNYVFESGYYDSGSVFSNIGTTPRSHSVLNLRIVNGLIVNAKGIRLQDCIDSCDFSGLGFTNCTENLNETACFYSVHRALMSRGSSGLSELPGFKFNNNVNAQVFDSVSVVDRNIGMEFSGGINGASLRAVNAEGGRVGLVVKDQVSAMDINSSYIENQTTVGMDLTYSVAKENLTVNNCYFNNVPVGIWGNQMRSGVTIGRGNYFVNTPVWVRINDNISAATVHLLDTEDADNGLPRIRSEYQLGPRINVVGRNLIYSSSTGNPVGCNIVTSGIVPLYYGGNSGYSPNQVMFTTVSKQTTTSPKFNIIIDTKIVYDPYVFYEFKFRVIDNDANVKYWGAGSGSDLDMKLLPVGKTVTTSNAGGFLRITIGEHSHPDGIYNIEGVVRIK